MFQPPSAAPPFPIESQRYFHTDPQSQCCLEEWLCYILLQYARAVLLESKHLHLFSKLVQEADLRKAFGWHLKRYYFPEITQSKGIKFVTKIDLKSVSSLVSSSMQTEDIIHDTDGSSSFHFHHTCRFDIQSTGKGNCQNRRNGLCT